MSDDAPATKGDLKELRDELRGEIRHAARATEKRLSWEIAHAASSITEAMADQIRALDDRYRDVPGRVSRLEARVDRLERDSGE